MILRYTPRRDTYTFIHDEQFKRKVSMDMALETSTPLQELATIKAQARPEDLFSFKIAGRFVEVNQLHALGWENLTDAKRENHGIDSKSAWLAYTQTINGKTWRALLAVSRSIEKERRPDGNHNGLIPAEVEESYKTGNPRYVFIRSFDIRYLPKGPDEPFNLEVEEVEARFQDLKAHQPSPPKTFLKTTISHITSILEDDEIPLLEELKILTYDYERFTGTPLESELEETIQCLGPVLHQYEDERPAQLRIIAPFIRASFHLLNTTDQALLKEIKDPATLHFFVHYAQEINCDLLSIIALEILLQNEEIPLSAYEDIWEPLAKLTLRLGMYNTTIEILQNAIKALKIKERIRHKGFNDLFRKFNNAYLDLVCGTREASIFANRSRKKKADGENETADENDDF